MKRHPSFKYIRAKYLILYRDISLKQNRLQKLNKLRQYYKSLKEVDDLDKKYNSFREQRVINPDTLSSVSWQIQGLESSIHYINQGIAWRKGDIRQHRYQLG